jgi:hypothetical protein
MVRDDNDKQKEKQLFPRDLTELGIESDDNDRHPEKQNFPRELTEFGIVRDDNDEHPSKQRSEKVQIASDNSTVWIDRVKMISSPLVILKFSDIK